MVHVLVLGGYFLLLAVLLALMHLAFRLEGLGVLAAVFIPQHLWVERADAQLLLSIILVVVGLLDMRAMAERVETILLALLAEDLAHNLVLLVLAVVAAAAELAAAEG
jgi:hypothetical protein